MVLTVGTDAYISQVDADTYWSDRNNSTWSAATSDAKDAAIREATQYLDGAYSFIGNFVTGNLLAWPRYDAVITSGNFANRSYDSTTIPTEIEDACAELALEALSSRLDPAADRGGAIKSEKVDVITVEYMDWAPSSKTYNFVTNMIKPLLLNQNNNTRKLERT